MLRGVVWSAFSGQTFFCSGCVLRPNPSLASIFCTDKLESELPNRTTHVPTAPHYLLPLSIYPSFLTFRFDAPIYVVTVYFTYFWNFGQTGNQKTKNEPKRPNLHLPSLWCIFDITGQSACKGCGATCVIHTLSTRGCRGEKPERSHLHRTNETRR